MEYYSAIKNNEFMKFLDKLIELENIILSEITQLQKNTHGIHSLMNGFYSQMLQITRIQFTDHRKLNRKKSKVWVLRAFLEGEENAHRSKYADKV